MKKGEWPVVEGCQMPEQTPLKGDIILELMDGRRVEATLASAFVAHKNKINVIGKATGNQHALSLTKVCCVCMRPEDNPVKFSNYELSNEEVILSTDKRYIVNIPKDQQTQNGFYGLSADASSPYKLIFFTIHGVKARRQGRYVGELLEEKGVITQFSINKALEEQKRLRERRLGDILSETYDLPQTAIDNIIDKKGSVATRTRIGEILIDSGLVTNEQVESALASQENGKRKKIGTLLIDMGLITESQLIEALATKFRLPFIDLDSRNAPTPKTLAALPADVVQKLQVLPLEEDDKRVVVATSEPTDHTIPDTLRFYTKRNIELVVATATQISAAILKYYPKEAYGIEELLVDMVNDVPVIDQQTQESDVSETDSQIVALVNKILLDAFSKGASDVHFEPGMREKPFQVRYRVDGKCRIVNQIPMSFKRAVIARIKIMSNLDITERRKPQSGKIMLWSEKSQIEYRVEITPTTGNNEDAVLRILKSAEPLPWKRWGFQKATSTLSEISFPSLTASSSALVLQDQGKRQRFIRH